MGIVNVTPDSFSDGGQFDVGGGLSHDRATAHGLHQWSLGADVLDVGGESTRPGSDPVSVTEELARVIPVVAALSAAGAVVSVDTSKPQVAREAIAAGAQIINDVTGLSSQAMIDVAAETGVGVVIMHMQGTPKTMQEAPRYDDVVSEVRSILAAAAERAQVGGVAAGRICIDPGIGFGKTFDHNLQLLDGLSALTDLGYPVLVGTSRKGFLGEILGGVPASDRDQATGVTGAFAIERGAAVIRVHNVVAGTHSARVADAMVRAARATEHE
ncbi:MAG: dihydropteroate synthase [Acidimicrobiia bacterium]|nr:dihydropteroate synthase [Acidimicrobiia bacterium]